MAERLAYLEAVIGADITQFRKGMREIRNEVGILSETMGGISKLGRTLTFGLTAPLVTGASFAIQAASGYDAAMRNVAAISTEVAGNFEMWSKDILQFGKSIREGPTAAAEALYTVFSAGVTNTDAAMAVMKASVATAEAGLADMTITTEALTSTILGFGLSMDTAANAQISAERASNSLTRMVQLGVGEMQDFATTMALSVPTAAALGIEMEDLHANIAILTQRGFSASRASTALNAALSSMVKPTGAMIAAFEELGVTGGEELIAKFGGTHGAIVALMGTTGDTSAELNKLFSTIRGSRAVNAFTNDLEAWEAGLADFGVGLDEATSSARAQQLMSFAAQFDLMKSAIQGLGISIGTTLFPVLTPLIQKFTAFVNVLSDTDPHLISLAVAGAAVAAALGPLLWLIGSLSLPVIAVTGAIVGLKIAWDQNLGDMQGTAKSVIDTIAGSEIFGKLQAVVEMVRSVISGDAFKLGGGGSSIVDGMMGGGALLPADLESTVGKVGVGLSDFITIKEGDTLWGLFVDGGYSKIFDWEAFKENVLGITSGNVAVLTIGDIVEIPTGSLGTELEMFMFGGFEGFDIERAAATGLKAAIAGTGGGGSAITEAIVPPLMDRIKLALFWAKSLLAPSITPNMDGIAAVLVRVAGSVIGGAIAGPVGAVIGGTISVPLVNAIVQAVTDVEADIGASGSLKQAALGIAAQISGALSGMGIGAALNEETGTLMGGFDAGGLPIFDDINKIFQSGVVALSGLIDTLQPTLDRISTGVSGFVESFSGLDTEDLSTIVSTIVLAAGHLASFAVLSAGFIAERSLPLIGTGVTNLVNGIAALLTGDFVTGASQIGAGMTDIINALVSIPAGIADAAIELLNNLTGMQWPTVDEGLAGWITVLESLPLVVSGVFDRISLNLQLTGAELSATLNNLRNDAAMIFGDNQFEGVAREAQANLNAIQTTIDLPNLLDTDSINQSLFMELNNLLSSGIEIPASSQQLLAGWLTSSYNAALAGGDFEAGTMLSDLLTLGENEAGLGPAISSAFALAAEEANLAAVTLAEGMNTSFQETLGIASPSTVMHQNGLDLAAGLDLGLIEGMVAPTATMKATFVTMQDSVALSIVEMAGAIHKATPGITDDLGKIKGLAQDVANAVNAASNAASSLAGIAVPQAPSSTPGRAGGGPAFAGQLYQTQEREPEFFMPTVSGNMVPLSQMGAKMGSGSGGGVSNTTNHITIQAQTVDELVFELDRRYGVDLTNGS